MKMQYLLRAKYFLFFSVLLFPFTLSHGEILAEGKTKIVRSYPYDPSLAIFEAKDDITAGDGAKHDIIHGKAELATATTCNVFRLLKKCGIPVAFTEQIDATSFLGDLCEMIPYEVVVRREAHGSYLKRNPYLEKGQVFPKLVVEFFLKTNNCQWQGIPIPKDDPFLRFSNGYAEVYLPHVPIHGQKPFMVLHDYPLKDQPWLFEEIALIAKKTFLILEKAWQLEGGRLVDYKVEFGFDTSGNLLLADVIDNDSWRVVQNEQYIDKQVYRDGGKLDQVSSLYKHVSAATANFDVPKQQIIIWRASETDNVEPFFESLYPFSNHYLQIMQITSSMQKNPVGSYLLLQEVAKEIPDSVIIASLGKSNGAGNTLSACTTLPVITTPAGWEKFHADLCSSMRTPSSTSMMTVIEPQSAVVSALQILAMRNPLLYMKLRLQQEERLVNVFELPEM